MGEAKGTGTKLYCGMVVMLIMGMSFYANASGDPAMTTWRINQSGDMGQSTDPDIHAVVSQVPADVQTVYFNETDVYVDATSIPSHPVGPFLDGNPSIPVQVDRTFRIPRTTPGIAGSHTDTGLGAIGVFANGIVMYNMSDATSYENEGVWNSNAIIKRGPGMDDAGGHPSPIGQGPPPGVEAYAHTHVGMDEDHTHATDEKAEIVEGFYHYHQQPSALREQLGDDGVAHSPILGFVFDGIPLYGPYGYDNTNGTGGVVRMESSYRLRSITTRTTLPDGSPVAVNLQGPPVNNEYPLGYFIEDHEFVDSLGHLDLFNGRFAVTPEYPEGVYAYYATIDDSGNSAYPYLLGEQYYGVPLNDNVSDTVTKPGGLTLYEPAEEEEDIQIVVSDAFAEAGNPFTLTAPAGTNYQWKFDGAPLSDDPPRRTGTASQALVFAELELGDAGTYTVVYDNGATKAIVESPGYYLDVLPVGSLPISSPGSLLALIGLILIIGTIAVALKQDRVKKED